MIDEKLHSHFLYASSLFAERTPTDIQTVLGSCVAVCLYDQVLHIGGMNHFMLPVWKGDGMPSAKYGNIAIEKLLQRMHNLGSVEKNIVAKVFGGADMLGDKSLYGIGKRNLQTAFDELAEKRIPVIASNVGGKVGRKVRFQSSTGIVYLKFVNE